jgi:dTDP-4-dehydrorhamnose reductase
MKVLLTGAAGQLGQALLASVPAGIELIATSRQGGAGLLPLDLADGEACRAESEPELALAVNGGAPRAFAEALLATGGRLLQVSARVASQTLLPV